MISIRIVHFQKYTQKHIELIVYLIRHIDHTEFRHNNFNTIYKINIVKRKIIQKNTDIIRSNKINKKKLKLTFVVLVNFMFWLRLITDLDTNNVPSIRAINTHKRLQKIRWLHLHFGSNGFRFCFFVKMVELFQVEVEEEIRMAFMLASSWCSHVISSNGVEAQWGTSRSISCKPASHHIHRISIFDSFWCRIRSMRNDAHTRPYSKR